MDLAPKDNKTLLVRDPFSMDDVVGNLFHYSLHEAEDDQRTIAQYFADGGYNSLWLTDIYPMQYDDYATDAVLNEDGTQTFYLWVQFIERQPTRPLDIELWLYRCHEHDDPRC